MTAGSLLTAITVPAEAYGGATEGVLVTWLYDNGAQVRSGDPIAEVMVEKATFEVLAPASGILRSLVEREGVVGPGTVIGQIVG